MSIATTAGLRTNDSVSLVLEGRITAYTAGPIWQSAIDTLYFSKTRSGTLALYRKARTSSYRVSS